MKNELNYPIKINWYLSYEVLYFEYDDPNLQQDYLVWENLILIKGNSPEEAYNKAVEHGKLSEDALLINERKGYCKFKGIRKLVPIYEEIEDGCELEWREDEITKEKLEELIPPKESLQAFLPLSSIND